MEVGRWTEGFIERNVSRDEAEYGSWASAEMLPSICCLSLAAAD